jgi:hypothetical protein
MAAFGMIVFGAAGEARLMVAVAILALVIVINVIKGLFYLARWAASPARPAPAPAYGDDARFTDAEAARLYNGRA